MNARIVYLDTGGSPAFDMPETGEVIAVEWQDVGGLGDRRRPCGVWLLVREPAR